MALDLRNMDCMDLMKEYPNKYFDLAIVDPPYGINMSDWDKITDIPKQGYWDELFRVSKNQIVFGGNYFNLQHTQSWICWDKTFNDDLRGGKLTKGGCPRENMSDFELIWTSFNHKSKMLRFTQIGNLIGFGTKISVDYEHSKKIHPTQKHIDLYKWILQNYAKERDKILDTHLGSGSIAIACHDYNFDLTASEINKEYFDLTMKRVSNHVSQLSLLH